jgi:hypothetical protein
MLKLFEPDLVVLHLGLINRVNITVLTISESTATLVATMVISK